MSNFFMITAQSKHSHNDILSLLKKIVLVTVVVVSGVTTVLFTSCSGKNSFAADKDNLVPAHRYTWTGTVSSFEGKRLVLVYTETDAKGNVLDVFVNADGVDLPADGTKLTIEGILAEGVFKRTAYKQNGDHTVKFLRFNDGRIL